MSLAKIVVKKFAKGHTQSAYRDIDDLYSVAFLACCEAVDKWDSSKTNGANLHSFANLVIQRRLIDDVYAGKKMTNLICLSLTPVPTMHDDIDNPDPLDANLSSSLYHTLSEAYTHDFAELDREFESAYVRTLIHLLTPMQQRVYWDMMAGKSYEQQAIMHNVTKKSIMMHRDMLMIRLRKIITADEQNLPRPIFAQRRCKIKKSDLDTTP